MDRHERDGQTKGMGLKKFLVLMGCAFQLPPSRSSNEEQCTHEPSLIFVKTHKTGGSTVATLLHRYARRRRLTVFVPPEGFDAHLWDLSEPFDRALVQEQSRRQLSSDNQYSMWTSHVSYHSYLHSIFPGPALLITIVREPISRWLSAFSFYDLLKRRGFTLLPAAGSTADDLDGARWVHPRTGPISESDAAAHIIEVAWLASDFGRNLSALAVDPSPWAFNGQATELAGNVHPIRTPEDVKYFVGAIAKGRWRLPHQTSPDEKGPPGSCGLELVMVLERFDESLLALKSMLGLPSWEDLLYLPMNTGKKPPPRLPESALTRLRELTWLDKSVHAAASSRLTDVLACVQSYQDDTGISFVQSELSNLAYRKLRIKNECAAQSTCEEMTQSDADWHRAMNAKLSDGRDIESRAKLQTRSLLSLESSCESSTGLPFKCSLADYGHEGIGQHDVFSLRTFTGQLILVMIHNFHLIHQIPTVSLLFQITPSHGCSLSIHSSATHTQIPKFALLERGNCSFRDKSLNQIQSGFSAVIIIDSDKSSDWSTAPVVAFVGPGLPEMKNHPIVMVTRSVGQFLLQLAGDVDESKSEIGRGSSAVISINIREPVL